jgi:pyrroloquinoline quinone (PQQ) biosynthesis protein C
MSSNARSNAQINARGPLFQAEGDTAMSTEKAPQTVRTPEFATIEAIDAAVLSRSIGGSAEMQRFARGNAPSMLAVAVSLAREFYPFCFEFSLFLAAAISHMRDERARLLLVANLYEEHGHLDASRLHPELFRAFVRELGLDPSKLEVGEGTAGAEAAAIVTSICRNGPAHRALAALYAIELLFGPACELMKRGLEHLCLPAEAMEFFHVHAGADVVHASQLRSCLVMACKTAAQRREALVIATDIAEMFYRLFDRIASAEPIFPRVAEAS